MFIGTGVKMSVDIINVLHSLSLLCIVRFLNFCSFVSLFLAENVRAVI